MTIKEFFSFKANKYFWLNLMAMVAVVCLLFFGVLKWLDSYTRHGEAVVVPNVKGMTIDEAEMLFRNHGLVCVVSDSSYVKNKPAGSILDVTPSVGQKVKEGRIIYLTINTLNIPLRPVPDVADNSSMRQAQAKILVYGVKYMGRQLEMGDKVPVGATLTLLVGDGEELPVDNDSIQNADSIMDSHESPVDDSWF